MKNVILISLAFLTANFLDAQNRPNVIIIYADDLGYGDLSSYNNNSKIYTPNIDQLASNGIMFTNGHCTSATCTPSRYAMMTGKYPWRKSGTEILPGNAALIIPTDRITLPKIFKQAGYVTALIGKWHLGLGTQVDKNWNQPIQQGPKEVGFDYSFIFPATADRVPTVFLENQQVVGLDSSDPIEVNYQHKIGTNPTGKENPELLKMTASHGHDFTIVNGIGRIGWMTGGKTTLWTDEELSTTFLFKAEDFIEQHKTGVPFFLCFALVEPHAPRMPATMFKGKSGLGFRGDVILQLDWTVNKILAKLKSLGILDNTIIIFSSDNGPVLDDGYNDGAVTQLNGHNPLGQLRGGKYSVFEGGTRVPLIVSWNGHTPKQVSNALVSQMDFLASFAHFLGQKTGVADSLDSENYMDLLLGKTSQGRTELIEQGFHPNAIISGDWKYIAPQKGAIIYKDTNIESANSTEPQLYNLKQDIGELHNIAKENNIKTKELDALLQKIKNK